MGRLPTAALGATLRRSVARQMKGPKVEFGRWMVTSVWPKSLRLWLLITVRTRFAPGLTEMRVVRGRARLPLLAQPPGRPCTVWMVVRRPLMLTAAQTPRFLPQRVLLLHPPVIRREMQLTKEVHLLVLPVRRSPERFRLRPPVLLVLVVDMQLHPITRLRMMPPCPPVLPRPPNGEQQPGSPGRLVSTVYRARSSLPMLPPKHAPVVARTLQVFRLKQTRPTHTLRTLPPSHPRLTLRVSTVLRTPCPNARLRDKKVPPVSRRATASLFRVTLWPARPVKTVWKTLTGLTLTRLQKWPLLVVTKVPRRPRGIPPTLTGKWPRLERRAATSWLRELKIRDEMVGCTPPFMVGKSRQVVKTQLKFRFVKMIRYKVTKRWTW